MFFIIMEEKTEIKIKELWWEDQNLHIVSTENKHLVFENAYLTQHTYCLDKNDNVIMEEIPCTVIGEIENE